MNEVCSLFRGFGINDCVDITLAVTGTAVHLERAQFAGTCHIEDSGLAHAELLGDFLPCEGTLFLGIHIQREDSLACGFDCVHHKLMEVGEVDGEENIGRVRVGHRRLKKIKKVQFHLGGMNLKILSPDCLASSHLRRRIKRHDDGPEKDIGVAVGFFLAGADGRFCRTVMSGMGAVVPVR